jgi:glycosyltransferase involved in cell wall biosynthesis
MQAYLLSLLSETQQSRVQFYGHVDRKVALLALASARVAVYPSRFESFANAPLEAMGCGCPTIVSSTLPPDSPCAVARK